MSKLMIAQFKWRVYRFAERLSLTVKLALALLAAALLSYVLLYRPQQQNLASLAKTQTNQTTANKAIAPYADVNAYTSQFPKITSRAAKINALIDIAKQQNILLDEITYKSDSDINHPINHYQMAFSVFAPYPEVHHFLSSILIAMPYVAIDSLNISRESVLDDVVEARIQLTFYFANTK
jgi:hypothetical protein